MQRRFRRDQIRKEVGNKNLPLAWQRFQMEKYKHKYHEISRGIKRRTS